MAHGAAPGARLWLGRALMPAFDAGPSQQLAELFDRVPDPPVKEEERAVNAQIKISGAGRELELLRRHRPALCFDAQEPYRAISAKSMVDNPGNLLALADGTVLARQGGAGDAALTLELLERYPHGLTAAKGDRLDAGPDELAAARRFQADPEYADRVYGRVAEDGGRTWLQYWCWYYYNPKHLLGFGKHEGDWEMVQIGLAPGELPEVVTVSQHESGEARPWERCEHQPSADGEHPVIYVAPFSHAGYFEAGAHPYPGGFDNPDGSLDAIVCDVEPLGPWHTWRGRWGASAGVLAPWSKGKLGGRSPASPGHQGTRWKHPAAYHREAQRATPFRKLGRVVRQVGKLTYPRLRSLGAELHGQELTVDWAVEASLARPASQLLVTVHRSQDPAAVLLSSAIELHGRSGTTRLLLADAEDAVTVRASAYNALRQRSDPLETTTGGSDALSTD